MINSFFKKFKKWWNGKPYESNPDSMFVFIGIDYPKPRIYWDRFKEHIEKNWQFWIGTVIAIWGLWLSAAK